jgi:hypothetical protein
MGGIYAVNAILLTIIVIWLLKRRRKTGEIESEQIILDYDSHLPDDK